MKKFIEKNSIFLHKTLNGLADSLIKIFVPVIILKATQNIYLAILFMIIRPLTFVLFNLLLKKFLTKYPKLSIILHIIPIVILQTIIFFVPINFFVIIILGVLSGLFTVFYTVPANLLFVFADKKLNVSKMEIGTNLGKILFIIIGGFIINSGSLGYLITLTISASLIYVLSILPLIFGSKLLKVYRINTKRNIDIFDKKEKLIFNLFHLSFGSFQVFIDEILPVFLFYNGLNFTAIATLQAGVEVAKLLSNVLANFFYKKNLSKMSIIIASGFFISSLILFLVIKNNVMIYVLSTIVGVSFPLVFIPNFKMFCEHLIKKTYLIDEVSNRDFNIFIGRPFLVASYFVGFSFIAPFILAMMCSASLTIFSLKLFDYKENASQIEMQAK